MGSNGIKWVQVGSNGHKFAQMGSKMCSNVLKLTQCGSNNDFDSLWKLIFAKYDNFDPQ